MAEALDDFSDFDDRNETNEDEILITEFNLAADHVPKIASTLDSTILLQIYALYKQANVGCCNIPKPSWFRTQDKAKWEAWSNLKDMPKEVAMKNYIDLITKIDNSWLTNRDTKDVAHVKKDKAQSWVAVSTLTVEESMKNDSEKNIFDFCKEGNLSELSELLCKTEKDILDDDGLGLLHWASDRGHSDILKVLLDSGHNINLKDCDGQTALHYAVSCGHKECIKILLGKGINKDVEDNDGTVAIELTDDYEIKQLL